MSDPTYTPPIGRLATDRYDFQDHIAGTNFRHKSLQIDANAAPQFDNATTVQGVFDSLAGFVDAQNAAGQGFITVGDGYDVWKSDNTFDNTVPGIDEVLNGIFSHILDSTDLPAGYERIKNGGFILIKAGTYLVKDTIDVPPGIIIIGEGYGTKLINGTRLDSNGDVDSLNTTYKPMFLIKQDLFRLSDNAVNTSSNNFIWSKPTVFANLVISDNFTEPKFGGDTGYQVPQNGILDTAITPLILQEGGSSLNLYNVKLIGRVQTALPPVVNNATRYGVGLDGGTLTSTGTELKVEKCDIDGFCQPIYFPSIGGIFDNLVVRNSNIRSFGYLDGLDNSTPNTDASSNCCIFMNDNNATITDNLFFGNHPYLVNMVYIDDTLLSVNQQSISKILVSSNNFIIDRGDTVSISPYFCYVKPSIASNLYLAASLQVFGNNFNAADGFSIGVNSSTNKVVNITDVAINLTSTNINLDGYVTVTGSEDITNDLYVGDQVNVNGALNVGGLSTFNGNIQINSASVNSSTLNVNTTVTNLTSSGNTNIVADAIGATTIQSGYVYFNAAQVVKTVNVSSSGSFGDSVSYTISSLNYCYLIDTNFTFTITLPNPSLYAGRVIVIKDISGFAGTNYITLLPPSGGFVIDGFGLPFGMTISSNWASVTLLAQSTGWYVI